MQKILIANRGEIACRIIRSAQAHGIQTVAVHSEADLNALHVEQADHAVAIGPPKPAESYLNIDAILDAARQTKADAVHPGYGFLAESAHFAERVTAEGLIWIGPDAAQIEAMGDKENARALAEAVGIPVLPGSARFSVGELDGLEETAGKVGFPLLVKASAGGGGIGMRLVERLEQLAGVVEATQTMAERSFGNGTIFLERYIPRARHIEIQVFGFGDGRAVHYFERECSIQRRFQKIIEESPACRLPAEATTAMANAAIALAETQNYSGAGTVEFIVNAETTEFYFLEMNTRIQVEHPVTEMTTGADLVALQIRQARGDDLTDVQQHAIRRSGHAIECRVYAENPEKMFLPSPGALNTFIMPDATDDVRVDTGVRQGDVITAYYDPMIAKLICRGDDRAAALERMSAALDSITIDGIANNVAFLGTTISHPEFQAGEIFTGFIDAYRHDLVGSGAS